MSNRPRIMPVNFFDDAVNLTPNVTPALPLSNLQLSARDLVWRSNGLGQQIITGDWGGNARQVSAWGIWPELTGGCLLGATVRMELFSVQASAQATANRVYDSGTLDVLAFSGVNYGTFPWGAQPWGIDPLDRTARLASVQQWFAAVAAASFKLTITNAGGVDTQWLGARRVWIADYVEAPDYANFGASPTWATNSQQTRTMGARLNKRKRAKWRELAFDFDLISETDRQVWSDILYQAELSNEIVFSMLPADSVARLSRDFTVLGSLKELKPMVWDKPIRNKVQFFITES